MQILLRFLLLYFLAANVFAEKISLSEQEKTFIQENPTLSVILAERFVSLALKRDARYVGYDDDLLELISQKTGLQFKIQRKDWGVAVNDFKKKKTEIISGFLFTKEQAPFPFFTIPNRDAPFYIRNDQPLLYSTIQKGLDSLTSQDLKHLNNKWFSGLHNKLGKTTLLLTEKEKRLLKANVPDKQSHLILSAAEHAYLNRHPVLKVQNLTIFPPFNFNENGVPLGYTIDYMNLMAKYIGVKIEYIQGKSWSEFLRLLKNGELDIIPHIAVTDERKKFIDYSSFNHIEYTIGIAIKKDLEIHSIDDLQNKIIAVTNKTFLHTHLQKDFPNQKLLLTESTRKAVEEVSSGKADAVIGSLPALHYYIQKNWLSNIKVIKIDGLGLADKTKLPMGVSKGNTLLLSILEKAHNMIPPYQEAALKEKWMNLPLPNHDKVNFSDSELAYLLNKKEIKLCINPHWKPFESIENGRHTGITAEYFKIFQDNLSVPIKLVETNNFQATMKLAKKKECDIVSLLPPTQENLTQFDLSDPYINTSIVIATKISTPFINDIPSITAQKIGVLKDCFCEQTLRSRYPAMRLVPLTSTQEGLEKVSRKELFGFIGAFPAIAPLIQENFVGDVKIAGKFANGWGFSMGIRNDEPQLLSIFNKLIQHIPLTKQQEMMNKWISFKIQNSIDYTKLIYITLFFLLVVLVALYKNKSINSMHKKLTLAHNELIEQQQMVNKYVLIIETDLAGVITEVNDAYCRISGFHRNELIGKTHKNLRHPDMSEQFFKEMWESISNNHSWTGEILNYTKKKEVKYFNTYINPIFRKNVKIGYRAICEDITDKKRVEELSVTDKLTGIFNRLKLDELIIKQVESYKRYKLPFSIVIIDVDNFKMINDTYGHDVGDDVLQQLANSLQKNVRITDYVGRWGGEEFLIICPNTVAENAFIVAEHLRAFIAQEHFNEVGSITVSLGGTEFQKNDTVSSIFKRADKALYEAKKRGKNKSIAL